MIRPSLYLLSGSIALFALTSCGSRDASTTAGPGSIANGRMSNVMNLETDFTLDSTTEKELIPLAEGNSWTYEVEVAATDSKGTKRTSTQRITYTVKKLIHEREGVDRAIFGVLQDGEQKDEQEWIRQPEGFFLLSAKPNRIPFTPRQPILRFPAKTGERFRWKGRGIGPTGNRCEMNYAFEYGEIQRADVIEGTMKALFLESTGTFYDGQERKSGALATNAWYRPGVGLIRYKQITKFGNFTSAMVLLLKTYTVKSAASPSSTTPKK